MKSSKCFTRETSAEKAKNQKNRIQKLTQLQKAMKNSPKQKEKKVVLQKQKTEIPKEEPVSIDQRMIKSFTYSNIVLPNSDNNSLLNYNTPFI
jgi:nitrate reductase alpha subunit